MSGNGNPLDNTIVAKAKAEMGALFTSTIQSLGTNMKDGLKLDDAASPLAKQTLAFAEKMIGLIAQRVQDVLPGSSGGSDSAS